MSVTVSRSIWLPVGRANFYSYTANKWLVRRDGSSATRAVGTGPARSSRLDKDEYRPLTQVSVLRRLLEVLPRSFGYARDGECTFAPRAGVSTLEADADELSRPVKVTLTLDLSGPPSGQLLEAQANEALRRAGVRSVTLTVDEDGFYVLRAQGADPRVVGLALDRHLQVILGGDFSLEWQFEQGPDQKAPIQQYNGLPHAIEGGSLPAFPPEKYYPRGILTFFQLNTLFEGLFNDALTPAVFFEQRRLWRDHVTQAAEGSPGQAANSVVRTVAELVDLIMVDADAAEGPGRAVAVRHFLAVTARESLQRFKWSVESVRRGLLDEMMGILHRQTPLVQLKLDRGGEWTPELAYGANESQLRGYVMLAGAKLPLMWNVHRHAAAVVEPLKLIDADLGYRLNEWEGLLRALDDSVRGLERSVEHAWMERLLYEQEQVRAEQEAMAEIERVRSSRPASAQGITGRPYNTVMLYVTILAAVAAVAAIQPGLAGSGSRSLGWENLEALVPAGVVTLALLAIVLVGPLVSSRRRSDSIGYEFAFRLDQVVDALKVRQQTTAATRRQRRALAREDRAEMRRHRATTAAGPARYGIPSGLRLDRRGGARIEYASRDNTVVKTHLTVSFRTSRRPLGWLRRRARFEVINEFLARQVSEQPQFFLRETRVFGEATRPLRPEEMFGLLTFVLVRTALVLRKDDDEDNRRQPLGVNSILRQAGLLFLP